MSTIPEYDIISTCTLAPPPPPPLSAGIAGDAFNCKFAPLFTLKAIRAVFRCAFERNLLVNYAVWQIDVLCSKYCWADWLWTVHRINLPHQTGRGRGEKNVNSSSSRRLVMEAICSIAGINVWQKGELFPIIPQFSMEVEQKNEQVYNFTLAKQIW